MPQNARSLMLRKEIGAETRENARSLMLRKEDWGGNPAKRPESAAMLRHIPKATGRRKGVGGYFPR